MWIEVSGQLPRPEPDIAPGRMLTGLRAFLETDRPVHYEYSHGINGLTIDVRATVTYSVNWGDGTTTTGHTSPGAPYPDGDVTHIYRYKSPGAPYPDGDVTHIYRYKGNYDITVTDTWTMEWRFPGGDWGAPTTYELEPVTMPGFVVNEFRSVRL